MYFTGRPGFHSLKIICRIETEKGYILCIWVGPRHTMTRKIYCIGNSIPKHVQLSLQDLFLSQQDVFVIRQVYDRALEVRDQVGRFGKLIEKSVICFK
jgi:hypothetical protein